jgi:hypothetical protein
MATLDADRALAAIDEALVEGRATAQDADARELQELALALEADTPRPSDELARTLGGRVAAGFPGRGRMPLRLPELRRPPLPVLAGAASALAALAVAAALVIPDSGEDAATPGPPAAASESLPSDRAAGAAPRDLALPPETAPPGGGGIAPAERNRRIERAAQLTLSAPGEELDRVADRIVAAVDRRRGFVLSSSVTSGEDGATGGYFELRVPARQLQATLRELSGLAHVSSRSQRGDDITREFVSVEDRLDAARAERRGLLRRLERATSDQQARAIRERLELVSAEIHGLRGRLRELRERVTYAQVTVTLTEEDGDAGGSGGGDSTRDALDDALSSLLGSLNLALRALGVLIPAALVGLLAALLARALQRRRREAALG